MSLSPFPCIIIGRECSSCPASLASRATRSGGWTGRAGSEDIPQRRTMQSPLIDGDDVPSHSRPIAGHLCHQGKTTLKPAERAESCARPERTISEHEGAFTNPSPVRTGRRWRHQQSAFRSSCASDQIFVEKKKRRLSIKATIIIKKAVSPLKAKLAWYKTTLKLLMDYVNALPLFGKRTKKKKNERKKKNYTMALFGKISWVKCERNM